MAQTKAQLLSPVGVVTATSAVIGSAVTITSTGINATSGVITATTFSGNATTATTATTLATNATGTNLTLSGNLTVNGTQTTINTQVLDVADKTVGVASTSTKTALTQDGGGLVIYGPSDINFTYDRNKTAVGLNTNLSVTGIVTATEFDIVGTTNTFNAGGVNVVGVVTATSFSGSGANLTGIPIPAGYNDLDNMLFG